MQQNQRIARQIADLSQLSYSELKERWITLFGKEPASHNHTFLVNRIAHMLQELTYGGLSEATRERMRRILLANGFDERGCKVANGKGNVSSSVNNLPVLGTRLSREWNGRRHEVTVVSGGFEYESRRYRSLTAVTRAITGTNWNGRAFFGFKTEKSNLR